MKSALFLIIIITLFTSCGSSSSASSNNDVLYSKQWSINYDESVYSLDSIDKNANIHIGNNLNKYTGKGVKIAIIDFGLDVLHEDLKGQIKNTYSLHNNSDVSDISQSGWHGTAITGIIAANKNSIGIRGIAYDSEISFIKLEDFTSDSEVIELFDKAVEFGADIISCSWSTEGTISDVIKDKLIDLATNGRDGKGISIVFPSGNQNTYIKNNEANISEMITVGATNKYNEVTGYSNYGDALDILAPGGEYLGIITTDIMGQNGYDSGNYTETFVGTSASVPIVSGVIALMLEKNPDLTRIEIDNILKSTADKIGTTPYIDGRNKYYGFGKINLSAIMNAI